LNAEVFLRWVGFPIQVFRAAMATIAAIFIIRSLRAFEVEHSQRVQRLQEAQLSERRNLESLRAELFQRTVRAQEKERQRVARELHDGIGQTLTALGMGIRGLLDTMEKDPPRATRQARQLQELATDGLDDLRHMVSGLHPPQLDDLGLVSALRSLGREVSELGDLSVNVVNEMHGRKLSPEVRVVLFRIVQEALTNVVRHAQASEVNVHLSCDGDQILLEIRDNGEGFDEKAVYQDARHPTLGLLGMAERAALIGGTCQVQSKPGEGTLVRVQAPFPIPEGKHE
jgi:two-component system sensor histidine kinase UhpB